MMKVPYCLVRALLLCLIAVTVHSLNSASQEDVFGLSARWPDSQLNEPTPTPSAPPSPTPTPNPSVPDIVVDDSGGGDFTAIGAAYAAASCGDLIQVREGTYTLSATLNLNKICSEGNEITIQGYPGEDPVVTCSDPRTGTKRVEFNGQWNIWGGIEVKGCYDGIKIYQSNNQVLNSYIHHNLYQGVLIAVTSEGLTNIVVDGNTIEYNGYAEGTLDIECNDAAWGGDSPKHCHGIYISDYGCQGTDGVRITNNVLQNHGGRGLQLNGSGCASLIQNTVVTGNIFRNNSWNVVLWHNVRGSDISGNTFILNSWPATDDSDHTQIGLRNSPNNTIGDNDFSSTVTGANVYILYNWDTTSSTQSSVDNNGWMIPSGANSNIWRWEGSTRSDFSTNYKSVTGWDANGTITVE